MKIVVRGTNWIGDSVMTVPALRALRQCFRDPEIVLYTRASAAGLFRDADFVDRVLPIDTAGSGLRALIREARRLRAERFDMAIVLPNSFASALPFWLARIPERFGYSTDARRWLLTDAAATPEWKSARHEVFYYLELMKAVERKLTGTTTIDESAADSSLSISDTRKENAREMLRQSGVDLSRPVVAIGAGSTNSEAKRWPADRFAAVAEELERDHGANIILLGSEGDRQVSEMVSDGLSIKPADLTGRTSIEEAAAILSVVDILIANDMGLAHVADAVGARTVVIFGPTNPVTTKPFSSIAKVVRHEVECSACLMRECHIDHRSMTQVTVEEVLTAAKRILENDA